MTTSIRPLFLSLAALALAGCYDYEQTILLRKDLSGSVSVVVTLHTDENEPGTSRDEFEKDRAQLVEEMRGQTAKQIPPGVRLRTLDLEWIDERTIAARVEIEFDHVRLLREIRDPEEEEGGGPGLGDFEIEETQEEWIVKMRLAEASDEGRQDLVPLSTYEGRTFRVTLRSEAPIASHNGEAVGPDVRWTKKMTEIVGAKTDLWAQWRIAK